MKMSRRDSKHKNNIGWLKTRDDSTNEIKYDTRMVDFLFIIITAINRHE